MAILYGKVRVYATAGTEIDIESALGVTSQVEVPTGATYVDIPLAGLEEYTLTANNNSETVLLNYGDFVEVSL